MTPQTIKNADRDYPLTFGTILPGLLNSYQQWKSFEKSKDEHKYTFFSLIDRAIEESGGAMKIADITALSEESALDRAKRHYPTWIIDEHRPHPWKPDWWEIILKENPSYQPYSIEHHGTKFSRTISKGAVMLDEEWLKEEEPELFEEVTYELPWGNRIACPLETLDQEIVARIKKYIYNDKPRVALAAPREIPTD